MRSPSLPARWMRGFVLCALLLSTLATGTATARAQDDSTDPSVDAPAHDHSTHPHPEAGFSATDADPCAALGLLSTPGGCTHGPDDHLAGDDLSAPTPLAGDPEQALPTAACVGDGISGPRIQVIYARGSDRANRYVETLGTLRTISDETNQIFVNSAARTGGMRHLRYVHDALCRVDIDNVVLSPTGDDSFDNMVTELQARGYDRADRKYMVFMDITGILCGIGNLTPDEDKAALANMNASGAMYARADANCWSAFVAAHEIMHTLGAVQNGAPNTTYQRPAGNPGGHCIDEGDVMCYSDYFGQPPMVSVCTNPGDEELFDCQNNDYFHTNPGAGNYLATHWNTADNPFLIGGASIDCPDFFSYESDDYLNWATPILPGQTQKHAFCTAGDHDDLSFPGEAGKQYRVQTFGLAGGADTRVNVFIWDEVNEEYAYVAGDDNGGGGLASLVTFTAATTEEYFLDVYDVANGFGGDNTWQITLTTPGEDTTAPTTSKPNTRFVTGVTAWTNTAEVELWWTGSDAMSAIGMFEIHRSIGGGAWSPVALQSPEKKTVTVMLTHGTSYRFRVRATDAAGNVGIWKLGDPLIVTKRSETDASIAYAGTWPRLATTDAIGGFVKRSNTATNTATLAFNGTSVSWLGPVGPDHGKAEVWIDGSKVATVDLYRPTLDQRRVVFQRDGLTNANHTIQVRVLASKNPASTGRKVAVDGFMVID